LSATIFISEVSWRRRQAESVTCPTCVPTSGGFWNLADPDDALFVGLLGPNGDLKFTSTFPLARTVRATTSASDHPGGVHVLLGDGSAKFVSDAIDSWTIDGATCGPIGAVLQVDRWWDDLPPSGIWQKMITRAGGETASH
jgi:hypothetical protein